MADIIPFRSKFDMECEQAIALELFGADTGDVSDGSRKRIKARRKRLGLTPKPTPDETG
jgi:hypothetical protein